MLEDVIVDTNVLSHACNLAEFYHGDAMQFLSKLQAAPTKIGVDEGFNMDPARNRSLIVGEYLSHLRVGSFGYALLQFLAGKERVVVFSKKVHPAISKKINQRVGKPRDRTFLRVTLNSKERVLVSHDYADFPQEKRDTFCKGIGALLCSAAEAIKRI